jgi:hypothetical protein
MSREGNGMAGDQDSGGTSFVAIDIGKAFHAVLVELPVALESGCGTCARVTSAQRKVFSAIARCRLTTF